MTRYAAWMVLASLAGVLQFGCYGSKLLRQPVTTAENARDLQAVREQQAALERRLVALEGKLQEQSELLRSMKAEMGTRADDLDHQVRSVDSKLRDALGARTPRGGTPSIWSATPAAPHPVQPPSSSIPPSTASPDSAEPTRKSSEPGPAVEPKRLYDTAYLDLNRGNYSLSMQGFREFLRQSPESDLGDNAQYWIGECLYAQRQYREAIEEFLEVRERYPRGDKVPAALLKIGYSFLQLEDRASARRYLNLVIEKFPNSDEAGLARAKLRVAG